MFQVDLESCLGVLHRDRDGVFEEGEDEEFGVRIWLFKVSARFN